MAYQLKTIIITYEEKQPTGYQLSHTWANFLENIHATITDNPIHVDFLGIINDELSKYNAKRISSETIEFDSYEDYVYFKLKFG